MEKKHAAWLLFDSGKNQKEIAKVLGVHEHTAGNWAKKGKWAERRENKSSIQESIRDDVYELIHYQTKVLKLKKQEWEKDLHAFEAGGKDVQEIKLIQRGDIDALQKLFTTVKGKVNTWSDYVEIIKEFMKYLEEADFATAKSLIGHAHQFLNHKRDVI